MCVCEGEEKARDVLIEDAQERAAAGGEQKCEDKSLISQAPLCVYIVVHARKMERRS